jgi:hypothetical protein
MLPHSVGGGFREADDLGVGKSDCSRRNRLRAYRAALHTAVWERAAVFRPPTREAKDQVDES